MILIPASCVDVFAMDQDRADMAQRELQPQSKSKAIRLSLIQID